MGTHITKSYRDLIAWQKAIELVIKTYNLTRAFPTYERYGLSSQMQRCAVSIPSNIAEGSYRRSEKDFHRFILIAYGSGAELETQLVIAARLGYCQDSLLQNIQALLNDVMRLLNRLAQSISKGSEN
jgi:four helix bundle protein